MSRVTPTTTKPNVIGSFVEIRFPDFEFGSVIAKVDTGAYTGALHCTKIHEQVVNGKPTLFFAPFDHPNNLTSTDNYIIKQIKSSNGMLEKRYAVDTNIVINKVTYPIILTLADRSDMVMPVLIGRRFLRKYNFLVDVNLGTEYRVGKG